MTLLERMDELLRDLRATNRAYAKRVVHEYFTLTSAQAATRNARQRMRRRVIEANDLHGQGYAANREPLEGCVTHPYIVYSDFNHR